MISGSVQFIKYVGMLKEYNVSNYTRLVTPILNRDGLVGGVYACPFSPDLPT